MVVGSVAVHEHLDVAHGVDMAIGVNVAIGECAAHGRSGVGREGAMFSAWSYGAFDVGAHYGAERTEGGEVAQRAALHVNRNPSRAGVAACTPIGAEHAEISVGKRAVEVLDPCFYCVGFVYAWPFGHFHDHAAEHPCEAVGDQIGKSYAEEVGMVCSHLNAAGEEQPYGHGAFGCAFACGEVICAAVVSQ